MKPYTQRDGTRRIWITNEQMEDLMVTELTKAGMMPSLPNPVIDLADFVEQHLKAEFDDYAELPAHILGETDFRIGRSPKVSINRDLTGAAMDDDESEPGLVGRWRATIAHEATHVLVHQCLYDTRQETASLFEKFEDAKVDKPPPSPTAALRTLTLAKDLARVFPWRGR